MISENCLKQGVSYLFMPEKIINNNNKVQAIYWQVESSKIFPANPCLLCVETNDEHPCSDS